MEKIDIVNSNLEVVRRGFRGEKLTSGEFLKFVHVWIVMDGKILIQKRSSNRNWAPNKWATHTGVVASMETEESCAIREVYEELGILINTDDIELGFYTDPIDNFGGIGFIFFVNIQKQKITIDNDEVCDYKFVTISELENIVYTKKFVRYFEKHHKGYYYSKVFKHLRNIIGGENE